LEKNQTGFWVIVQVKWWGMNNWVFFDQCLAIYRVSKNEHTLASCSYDKHGLILIILVNSISTLSEIICIFYFPCPFTFTSFPYLLLNTCDGNDVTSATWSSTSLNTGKHITKCHWRLVNGKSGYVHVWRWKDITLTIW